MAGSGVVVGESGGQLAVGFGLGEELVGLLFEGGHGVGAGGEADRGLFEGTELDESVGDLDLPFECFPLPADPSRSLLTYTAEPGSPTQDALHLLASWAATDDTLDLPRSARARSTMCRPPRPTKGAKRRLRAPNAMRYADTTAHRPRACAGQPPRVVTRLLACRGSVGGSQARSGWPHPRRAVEAGESPRSAAAASAHALRVVQPVECLIDDLLITRRHGSAAYGLYQRKYLHPWSHHAR